ncbi:MAG: efflux RND transporter periplasmic adaptor subunit [Woeseiaceae bacterium]
MKKLVLSLVLLAALAAAGYGGYRYAEHRVMTASATPPAEAGATGQESAGRRPLYWYDPMYPQQRFDKPGKSPFMDMQLVPKYADEIEGGAVTISPQVVQNLGVRTAQVRQGTLEQRFDAVGTVAYNERGVVQLQARAAGFVEKLHARAPLDPVKKGAPLVDMLYPEWTGAQEEYLLLRKSASADVQPLAQAARQRLALLGMTEGEIASIERAGRVRQRFTRYAPISGVIAELGLREGMAVMPGHTMFRIVDLSTVWVNAEIPETQAAAVVPGSRAEARVAAYPDVKFEGRVGAILPEVSAATRTVRTRIELANPGELLKPGMFATLSFTSGRGKEMLLVPTEAVIRTGERSIVIVSLDRGRFSPQQVEVGIEQGGLSEIRKGIGPGATVVMSGQFLIDSEASLSGAVARLETGAEPAAAASPAGKDAGHRGRGEVGAVDRESGQVELQHEPIASLQWPAMRMGFIVEEKAQLATLKPGDAVEFELRAAPDKHGNYIITRIGAAK